MSRAIKRMGIQVAMIVFIVFFFQCEDWICNMIGISPFWETDMVAVFSKKVFHGLYSRQPDVAIVINACISIIVFNILYGSFIYDELHGTGIYYFIRYQTRKKWFVLKIVTLLWSTFVFHAVYIGLQYICSLKLSNESVNPRNLGMLISYTAYLTILCFMTSMLMNILSVRFGRVIAFIAAYAVLVIMRRLVLSVGDVALLGTDLEVKALIPINLTLNEEGCFATDTYLSLSFTVLFCCILIVVFYHIIRKDNIGLLIEEKHI